MLKRLINCSDSNVIDFCILMRYIKSSNRFYYLKASILFLKTPEEIYKIVHSDKYFNNEERKIFEHYIQYISKKY